MGPPRVSIIERMITTVKLKGRRFEETPRADDLL